MTYRGVAPLTIALTTEGRYVYVFGGDAVVDPLDEAELDRLLAGGYLTEEPSPTPAES